MNHKKSTGDWHHWFTAEDVEIFKPAFVPYMELIGYDCDDWAPSPNPVIEPEYSSVYMQNLPREATRNSLLRYIESVIQRFGKRALAVTEEKARINQENGNDPGI